MAELAACWEAEINDIRRTDLSSNFFPLLYLVRFLVTAMVVDKGIF